MDCMREEFVTERVCLGDIEAGTVVVFPNHEELPLLVTDNKRPRTVNGGAIDTVGVVNCSNGSIGWYSDRYDCIPVANATLVYRITGKGPKK